MTLHQLLALIALGLNLALAAVAMVRNPTSRLNRLFVCFVGTMVVWNGGAFMLRRSATTADALAWELVIHVAVIAGPVLYYHFALVFVDGRVGLPLRLLGAYLIAAGLIAMVVGWPGTFMRGVRLTPWGWAPLAGPAYPLFVVHVYGIFTLALLTLWRAYRAMDSSFRRHRTLLVIVSALLTLGGGTFDVLRFAAGTLVPRAELIYPLGIPANMVCALMLGLSIVRYRMFDVDAAVKKIAVYAAAAIVLTATLGALILGLERGLGLQELGAVWLIGPLGVLMALLLSPVGRRVEGLIYRAMFSRRRGCYDTLLSLSKRMNGILDRGRLVETLVHGVVKGVPLTHAVVLVPDPATRALEPACAASAVDRPARVMALPADSGLLEWIRLQPGPVVMEEMAVDPRATRYLMAGGPGPEDLDAAIVVPLRLEESLQGVLVLGEKLSGEIFDDHELELLALLGHQAAIALQNAELYAEVQASNVRLAEASRLKSQFLASMSHELRTPLNSIIGFSKVLLNGSAGPLNERQAAYVGSVHSSSVHLLELITEILDISRIEAGKLTIQRAPVDLAAVVTECVEASRSLVRGKPLRLEADVAPDLPAVAGDRTKLTQVLLNMLSNAIKFTPAGRVLVRAERDGDAAHVSVADTGVGIPAEALPRLFQPFERIENPLTRAAGGTGLGLAISKKFVEMHGGTIWAESHGKHGCTFHFTVPLATPDAAAAVTSDAALAGASA